MHISKHSPFDGPDPQDHGWVSVEHISKLSCTSDWKRDHARQPFFHSDTDFSLSAERLDASKQQPGTSVSQDDNHLTSHKNVPQTSNNDVLSHISREKMYTRVRLLGPLFKLGENRDKIGTHVRLLGPCLATASTGKNKTVCLGAWNLWSRLGTRSSWSRFPHDEMDTALNWQVR